MQLLNVDQTAWAISHSLGQSIPRRHVYYLLSMGVLEGTKASAQWRIWPFSVEEYVKHKGKSPVTNPAYCLDGSRGFRVYASLLQDGLQSDTQRSVSGLQRRWKRMERVKRRLGHLSHKKLKHVVQLEFDLGE